MLRRTRFVIMPKTWVLEYLDLVKILITTVFFPPQNAIASQRPYSWAAAWSRAGHEVTVLTIEKDRERADLAPMRLDGFRTIEVPTGRWVGWFRKLWKRLRRGKTRATHASLSVMQSQPGHRPATRLSSPGKTSGAHRWLRRRGFLSSVRWPDVFDLWVSSAIAKIPDEKFDLIISTFGPPASLAVGRRAKAMNPQAKWICDFRDLWSENHVYPGFWPITCLERWFESRYLRDADLITTVSEGLARSLRTRVDQPDKVGVFENGFRASDLSELDPLSVFGHDERRRLVYTGSLHPTQRNPRPLFEAISRLTPDERSTLDVVFVGPREAFIDALVEEFSLADQVRSLGSLPRNESLRYQRDADILLFLEMQHEAARDGVLTGKLFEYLATGRPIWAIGVDSVSTVGSLLNSSGSGEAMGRDIELLVRELRELVRSPRKPSRDLSLATDVTKKYERTRIANEMLLWIGDARSLSGPPKAFDQSIP